MARALKHEDNEVCILEMRKNGVLLDLSISRHKKEGENGAILLTCSDGHLFADVYLYLLNFFDFIHPIAVNGGPLLMSFYSEREFLLKQIKKAKELKNVNTIITTTHWPCGIANELGLTAKEVSEKTFFAEQVLKYSIAGIESVLGYSIDYRRFASQNHQIPPRVRTYKLQNGIFQSAPLVHP